MTASEFIKADVGALLRAGLPVHPARLPDAAEVRGLDPLEAVRAFCAWAEHFNGNRADATDVSDASIVEMLRDGLAIRRADAPTLPGDLP